MLKLSIYPLIGLMLLGHAHAGQDELDEYLSLIPAGPIQHAELLGPFEALFEDLDGEGLAQRIKNAYAENIYFNDTIVTLHARKDLVAYLEAAREKTNFVNTKILDVTKAGGEFYVRWVLEMEFEVLGKARYSRTVGLSHLRFNEDGKIVVHKDFWDSADGIYRHLPVIGGLISWAQRKLQDGHR